MWVTALYLLAKKKSNNLNYDLQEGEHHLQYIHTLKLYA